MKIGILAFQGDFKLHEKILNRLNVSVKLIRYKEELSEIKALIIPGGESTVISKMLVENNFISYLRDFSQKKSIYGTCAGAIIMSSLCSDKRVENISCIDIEVKRNAWGRQIDSFVADVQLNFSNDKKFEATFIRAPKFKVINNKADVLAVYKKEPVLIRNNKHLVSSFHPEVKDDLRIHEYFISMIDD